MKKVFLLITLFGLFILSSCGGSEATSSKKTMCECVEEAMDTGEESPLGCEWLDEISEKETEKMFVEAMKDCPDIMSEVMEVMMSEEEEEEEAFDGGDFIDYTENYEGQIFEWELYVTESIYSPESIRDYKGKDVKFQKAEDSEPNFPSATNIIINIPEDLKLPKAVLHDDLIVKFKCGGSLTEGNVALAVSRPKK